MARAGVLARLRRWWSGAPRGRPVADRRQRALGWSGGDSYEAGMSDSRSTARLWDNANLYEVDWDVFAYLVTVRARSRYELRNSGYLEGIVRTWSTDVVGPRGPSLEVHSDDGDFNAALEYWFGEWSRFCDAGERLTFAEWLRLGERQQWQAGEDLAQLAFAEDDRRPLRFRVRSLEPDLITTPFELSMAADVIMGVRIGNAGQPLEYCVLEEFPAGGVSLLAPGPYRLVQAADVIHDYRQVRPGQTRGMPWLTPVLDTATIYRDWVRTCLVAQQHAAKFSVVFQTDHPDADFDDLDDELPTWDLEGGVAATVPRGWKAEQISPTHPGTSFEAFSAEVMRQIARPVAMPLIRARCDAGGSNYSSGRLDILAYWREVETRQAEIEARKCDRCLREVQVEAELRGLTPPAPERWEAVWTWPSAPVIDEYKDAQAAQIRLSLGTTSLADEVQDWEALLETRKRIEERAAELGVELMPGPPAAPQAVAPNQAQDTADLVAEGIQ